MLDKAIAAWRWLPLLLRGLVAAFVVQEIGSTLVVLILFGNLKLLPSIPWALPATLAVLLLFWRYFTGAGYPAATRASREQVTRAKSLPGSVWLAALPPMLLGLVTVSALRLLLPSMLPIDAPKISIDLNPYPTATVLGLLLSIAISSGVTEEVAFRGYLQKPLEDTYGIAPALLITGLAFWLAHADKASLTHLPFHLAVSVFLGLIVYMTRSLLPAIMAHAAGDALLQPAYFYKDPAFVWSALTSKPVWDSAGDSSLMQKLVAIGEAMEPTRIAAPGPHQTFAILVWVFIAGAMLTSWSLLRLRRATRDSVSGS